MSVLSEHCKTLALRAVFKMTLEAASFIKESTTEQAGRSIHNFITPVKTDSGFYGLLTTLLKYSPNAKELAMSVSTARQWCFVPYSKRHCQWHHVLKRAPQ